MFVCIVSVVDSDADLLMKEGLGMTPDSAGEGRLDNTEPQEYVFLTGDTAEDTGGASSGCGGRVQEANAAK